MSAIAPEKTTKSIDWSKWIRFALLVMAGGTIYKLSNLKDAFYVPMQEAMGLSHTEIGTLLSVNSIVATALFVVGGYLADRFSTRVLIPLGLVGCGALGLFLSTFPGFNTLLVVFALLAVCSDCLVWPALLKSIRQLGGSKEQGRLFGLLEGGRGVVDTAVAFSALGIFVWLGSGVGGFRAAIAFYAILDIAVGVLLFLLLRNQTSENPTPRKHKAGLAEIWRAAKLPQLWWVSFTVFMVYVVYCGLTYFIPYLTYVYGLPVALVGAYGIINQYGLKILGGPIGGVLVDKVFKGASRYIRLAFLCLIPVVAVLLLLPADPGSQIPAMIVTLLFSLIIFTMRGVFWAPMDEVGIPEETSGTAFGIACLVGYAPGMFAFIVYGSILDANPGAAGYHIVFIVLAALALVGALVSSGLVRVAQARRAAVEVPSNSWT
ncbi:MFS transporter [Paenarthrobacter aromaticivorans]|uniref:MFS transporter n=1 Tax=Paenarthrobacter aromaticivorans TaxID=2849150 RepID=UPI003A80B5CD